MTNLRHLVSFIRFVDDPRIQETFTCYAHNIWFVPVFNKFEFGILFECIEPRWPCGANNPHTKQKLSRFGQFAIFSLQSINFSLHLFNYGMKCQAKHKAITFSVHSVYNAELTAHIFMSMRVSALHTTYVPICVLNTNIHERVITEVYV